MQRLILVAVAVVGLVGCGPLGAGGAPGTSTVVGEADEIVTRRTLDELVRSSDAVVVATVRAATETRNMARNPQDPRLEHPSLVIVGQDYELTVEQAVRGSVSTTFTLTVARSHGLRGQTERLDKGFIPLAVGGRYVLFLRHEIDGTEGWVPAFEPYRFRVTDKARPESQWDEARTYFPAIDLASFVSAIKAAP